MRTACIVHAQALPCLCFPGAEHWRDMLHSWATSEHHCVYGCTLVHALHFIPTYARMDVSSNGCVNKTSWPWISSPCSHYSPHLISQRPLPPSTAQPHPSLSMLVRTSCLSSKVTWPRAGKCSAHTASRTSSKHCTTSPTRSCSGGPIKAASLPEIRQTQAIADQPLGYHDLPFIS